MLFAFSLNLTFQMVKVLQELVRVVLVGRLSAHHGAQFCSIGSVCLEDGEQTEYFLDKRSGQSALICIGASLGWGGLFRSGHAGSVCDHRTRFTMRALRSRIEMFGHDEFFRCTEVE